jgi:hypothetical protein
MYYLQKLLSIVATRMHAYSASNALCGNVLLMNYHCVALTDMQQVAAKTEDAPKKSESAQRRLAARQKTRTLDPALDDQFASGRILACISSRPGQVSA